MESMMLPQVAVEQVAIAQLQVYRLSPLRITPSQLVQVEQDQVLEQHKGQAEAIHNLRPYQAPAVAAQDREEIRPDFQVVRAVDHVDIQAQGVQVTPEDIHLSKVMQAQQARPQKTAVQVAAEQVQWAM
jgi:hypothetical protein